MKQFLLFAGHDRANGGWHEYRGAFEEKEVAIILGRSLCEGVLAYDWWHVVDIIIGQMVEAGTAN